MWLLVLNSTRSIGGIHPLWHWSRYCMPYRLFQLQLFWYLSTRMGPNPLFLFSMLQWVVTPCDYSWMNSTRSIGGTIPLLWHIGAYVQALPAPTIFGIFQPGWALTLLFLFSTLQWVTYMWLLVDEFNSAVLWNYPHFFESLRAVIVHTGHSSNYFLHLPTRVGPNFVFSACLMGWNVHVTTRGWIQLAVLAV
jgi:hypothetical protein